MLRRNSHSIGWEGAQTFAGYNFAMLASTFRRVDVGYYHGATIVTNALDGKDGGVLLGNYISTAGRGEVELGLGKGSYTTMYEFGHYLQSQVYGPLYLPKIGIQSVGGASWTEHDANYRAARYFNDRHGFKWDSNYYDPSHPYHKYSYLPNEAKDPKWWEYGLILLAGIPFLF